ncbi:SCO1664 family protein [Actinacidiphila alni]|uniref:SCO1664 family protein n=1 Tax=Actinacidiphila alni TaxID=380248 RepID=UPI0034543E29
MPASERVPEVGLKPAARPGPEAGARPGPEVLLHGELTVRGQVRDASNAVLFCETEYEGRRYACAYKPVAGERPLWDFPDGTLAQREVAAYLVSEATGWGLVPPTVLRDGPYGEGMVQLWIDPPDLGSDEDPDEVVAADVGPGADADEAASDDDGDGEDDGRPELFGLTEDTEPAPGWKRVVEAQLENGRNALLVHADDIRLRRLAVLDAVINNADRKGGHLLAASDGRLYGIDHGVTFHTEDKLRTLLWGWAGEPLTDEAVAVLHTLQRELSGALGDRLGELITEAETAALRARTDRLLRSGIHPAPGGDWPSIPWPPV